MSTRDGTVDAHGVGLHYIEWPGDGPPIILVCGGSVDRMSNAPLAAILAERFTVFNYDRRGRGDSGDAAPYAVEREIEDIDAMVEEVRRSQDAQEGMGARLARRKPSFQGR